MRNIFGGDTDGAMLSVFATDPQDYGGVPAYYSDVRDPAYSARIPDLIFARPIFRHTIHNDDFDRAVIRLAYRLQRTYDVGPPVSNHDGAR